MDKNAQHIDRMYTDIEWALSEGFPVRDVIPMVERLMLEAEPLSLHSSYAKRQLAELIARQEPFRAARLARDVLQNNPEDDRAHAVLGLACMLMGHFHLAERSYRNALQIVPHCPWYAHNLGHLLDVAMHTAAEAIPWLLLSRRALPEEPEIASSYAHALLGVGRSKEARAELLEAVGGDESRADKILASWTGENEPQH